jgi:hypothetical protein
MPNIHAYVIAAAVLVAAYVIYREITNYRRRMCAREVRAFDAGRF